MISENFAEILGLLCAEGCHIVVCYKCWCRYGEKRYFKNNKSNRIEFYNKNQKLLKRYKNLLKKEFNYTTKITKHGKINICKKHIVTRIIDKTELGHLKWKVPNKIIKTKNNKIKIAFIRGYFNGDGTTSNRVRFFSTNKIALKQVSLLLIQLKIEHTFPKPMLKNNRKPLYLIQISERERERFLKKIKPSFK